MATLPTAGPADLAQLVEAWILGHRPASSRREREPYDWAADRLDALASDRPGEALAVIWAILERSDDERVLANLAAGPLEDLLVRHGPEVIVAVEARARVDARARKLLGAVWRNAIAEAVWQRLRKLAGPSW